MTSNLNTLVQQAARNRKLPDFIIAGAMKSGTTSLHYILGSHHRVFIPRKEIFFFSIDDVDQHLGFFRAAKGKWINWDYDRKFKDYLGWYESFFRSADPQHLIGEDSPTYMASHKAPRRIAELLPRCKLIFMMRDPVARLYSHYWQLVASGRAFHSFESTIRYTPGNLLQRGFYKSQIEAYARHFPKEQMKFVLLEQFNQDVQKSVDEISEFLGLMPRIDVADLDTYHNRAMVPRHLLIQLAYNRLFPQLAAAHYVRNHLPGALQPPHKGLLLTMDKHFKRLNLRVKRYPPMDPRTRAHLEQVYANENRGIAKLTGIDVSKYWTYMD